MIGFIGLIVLLLDCVKQQAMNIVTAWQRAVHVDCPKPEALVATENYPSEVVVNAVMYHHSN